MGWGFNPTAQSGRGGNGCCCEEAVDVYVRREDDEVVDDDCKVRCRVSQWAT